METLRPMTILKLIMAAIISSESLSIVNSAVIACRREHLRHFFQHEARCNPRARFPYPTELLLNLLALQGTAERIWRERQSRIYDRRLAWHLKRSYCPRYTLLLAMNETIAQIDAMTERVVIIEQKLRGALCLLIDHIERLEPDPNGPQSGNHGDDDDDDGAAFRERFAAYSEFCFDLIRYGAANQPNQEFDLVRAFSEKVERSLIPVHPVRMRHPKGVIIA